MFTTRSATLPPVADIRRKCAFQLVLKQLSLFRSGRAIKTAQLQKSDKRQIGGTKRVSTAVGTATTIVVPHRATTILAQIAVPQSTFVSVDKFILMTS